MPTTATLDPSDTMRVVIDGLPSDAVVYFDDGTRASVDAGRVVHTFEGRPGLRLVIVKSPAGRSSLTIDVGAVNGGRTPIGSPPAKTTKS